MWLGKFLDLEEDLEELSAYVKKEIFDNLLKNKLTPLEFTIIETIFNSNQLSGYDLIKNLNRSFAGTWEAQSGTIYPILRKLEKEGFLKAQKVKSPIGPIKKVYSLTEAGDKILKFKVNRNYYDQLKFVENFLVELSSVFIRSFPSKEQSKKISEIQNALTDTLKRVMQNIPPTLEYKTICTNCNTEIGREVAYCPQCGKSLFDDSVKK
ncbi:MAG: helix-turn-helix transcriptional regulator [Promethearchaeota archaeon]|nr:MAG: helix-turn-helix transcriptional regulator [Candidatus Lokiarchaeota archaeon]